MNSEDRWDILSKDSKGHYHEHFGQRGYLGFRLEDIRKAYDFIGVKIVAQWAVPEGYGIDTQATPDWELAEVQ